MVSSRTLEFISAVDDVDCIDRLVSLFEENVRHMGVKYFVLGEIAGVANEPPIAIGNYPEEWFEHYVANDFYYHDPVAHKASTTFKPFSWRDLETEGWVKGRGREIIDNGREFGLKAGASIPIFRSNGYLAVASFVHETSEIDGEVLAALELITVYFHARLSSLREKQKTTAIRLSGRERECLHWAAVGKTDWEIGEILTISQDTVHRHVENAKRKYGVKTRVQAVLAAVRGRQVRM